VVLPCYPCFLLARSCLSGPFLFVLLRTCTFWMSIEYIVLKFRLVQSRLDLAAHRTASFFNEVRLDPLLSHFLDFLPCQYCMGQTLFSFLVKLVASFPLSTFSVGSRLGRVNWGLVLRSFPFFPRSEPLGLWSQMWSSSISGSSRARSRYSFGACSDRVVLSQGII